MSSGEAQAQVVDLTLVDDSDDDNNNSNLCEFSRFAHSACSSTKKSRRSSTRSSSERRRARKRDHIDDGETTTAVLPIACVSEGHQQQEGHLPKHSVKKSQETQGTKARRLCGKAAQNRLRFETTNLDNTGASSSFKAEPATFDSELPLGSQLLILFEDEAKAAGICNASQDPHSQHQQHPQDAIVNKRKNEDRSRSPQIVSRAEDLLQNLSTIARQGSALEEPEPTTAKRLFQQPPLIVEVQNTGDSATDSNMENNLTIRIAFLGNVSLGKSTLLNVVLGERYNPTSMKRTTSGVREFHLVPQLLSRKRKAQEFSSFQATAGGGSSGAAGENGDQDHVRIIRDKIHQDNEAQRELQTMDDPMVFRLKLREASWASNAMMSLWHLSMSPA
ncbi:hypothetical protein ACA910_004225 [Epithemia clementina (nom. ined.)]